MIDLSNIKKIYVYQKKVDLRYGINKLSILAQELVALSNMKHTLFIFYGTTNKNIKIIELDNDGWWLYQKKLHTGKYLLDFENIESIEKYELDMLLNGLSVKTFRKHKEAKISVNY